MSSILFQKVSYSLTFIQEIHFYPTRQEFQKKYYPITIRLFWDFSLSSVIVINDE